MTEDLVQLDSPCPVRSFLQKKGLDNSSSLNKEKSKNTTRRRRCGKCTGCQRNDCEMCKYCLDKLNFGGSGMIKRACANRNYKEEKDIEEESFSWKMEVRDCRVSEKGTRRTEDANLLWEVN